MKHTSVPILLLILHASFLIAPTVAHAQNFQAVNRCGGTTTLTLPSFTDADQDGLADAVEQMLLAAYVPKFVVYVDDDCPGPAIGTSNPTDSNIVVCHIFPMFQQYVNEDDEPVLYSQPAPLVAENCLRTDLAWFDNTILIYGALLYGRDCGLTGHTADVEGYAVSVRYLGTDDGIAWRTDTDPANWQGHTIQTTSHAGTICEGIETFPWRSNANPTGKDTIFPSPDKHGNYLTEDQCSSSFICDPACNDPYTLKRIKVVNVGEENYPMTTDLGAYYSGYVGESPWSNVNFVDGNAGTIKEKMLREWRDDFMQGQPIATCEDICTVYNQCHDCGSTIYADCISDCQGIPDNQTGCNSPEYSCITTSGNLSAAHLFRLYPIPTDGILTFQPLGIHNGEFSVAVFDVLGRQTWNGTLEAEATTTINLQALPPGIYTMQVQSLISNNTIRFAKH